MEQTRDKWSNNPGPWCLQKEIEKDIRNENDIPCSWIGRNNIVKNGHFTKCNLHVQYKSIQIPMRFFIDLDGAILNFIWKNKEPRIAKTILYNKGIPRSITIFDSKLYAEQ